MTEPARPGQRRLAVPLFLALVGLGALAAFLVVYYPFWIPAAERAERATIARLKDATERTARGRPIDAGELAAFVTGKTHGVRFGAGAAAVDELRSFEPGGVLVWIEIRGERATVDAAPGAWSAENGALCLTRPARAAPRRCFTLAEANDGRVQYFFHEPGGRYHGLLALTLSVVKRPN
jgi:hypothetical protein